MDSAIQNANNSLMGIPDQLRTTLTIIAGIAMIVAVAMLITSGQNSHRRNAGVVMIAIIFVGMGIVWSWSPILLPWAQSLFS